MNKPVIVTEEALAAPVVAPGLPAAADAKASSGPAYAAIGGLSFSHFLNDTMQSLIPSVYPILKLRARLRADRPDHDGVPVHDIAAATWGPHLYRPQGPTLFTRDRHVLHLRGPDHADLASQFAFILLAAAPSASARRCFIRNPRASRGSHPAAATALRRRCSRSAVISAPPSARCWPRPSSAYRRPAEHRLVLLDRVRRDMLVLWTCRPLVQAARRSRANRRRRQCPANLDVAADHRPRGAGA